MNLRDPAALSLLGTPFDPFAHLAEVRAPTAERVAFNLPNLAIFLWRLAACTVPAARPVWRSSQPTASCLTTPGSGRRSSRWASF